MKSIARFIQILTLLCTSLAHGGTLEDYMVDNSPMSINGYIIQYTDAPNDQVFAISDNSALGKLMGNKDDGHIIWDMVDPSNFSSYSLNKAEKTMSFGTLLVSDGADYLADLASKDHPLAGRYVHYGKGEYDWLFLPYGAEDVLKLEGKDGENGNLIWKSLNLRYQDQSGEQVAFSYKEPPPPPPPPNAPKGYILFAHGLGATPDSFITFAHYAEDQNWKTYRFQVDPIGSIADRAYQLALQILDADQTQPIPDGSLVTVGHSMGGLDLRYIIGMAYRFTDNDPNNDDPQRSPVFYAAAKKIKKIYTLATPHKGNMFSGGPTPATEDLQPLNMARFNRDFPYHKFKVDGRQIPFLAIRFSCVGQGLGDAESDGVVSVKNQSWNDAPHSALVFNGTHSESAHSNLCPDAKVESDQVGEILQPILDDSTFATDTHDIIFLADKNCGIDFNTGSLDTYRESGVFSHNDDGYFNCLTSFACDDGSIQSVLIYPSTPPDTLIKLYNDPLSSYRDDWARIHVDDELQEPACISDLEDPGESAPLQPRELPLPPQITFSFHGSDDWELGHRLSGLVSSIFLDRSSQQYDPDNIVFYEGNDCLLQVKGVFRSRDQRSRPCDLLNTGSLVNHCDNDEIRSVKLYPGLPENTVIQVHNAPDGSKDDDWTRIHIGKTLTQPICIDSLQQQRLASTTVDGADGITIDYRRYDGLPDCPDPSGSLDNCLDGKVSYVSIKDSSDAYDPEQNLVFYEALNCQEGVKAALDGSKSMDINCTASDKCDNDEISSLKIYPTIPSNRLVKVYNHPSPDQWDDWTRIHLGDINLDTPFCINGFEHQTSNREKAQNISVSFHPDDDDLIGAGLNGKISRIKTASSTSARDPDNIVFYEGNNCTQGIKGVFRSGERADKDCTASSKCDNDEIRSVLLYPGLDANTIIELFDAPAGTTDDDWTRIHIGSNADITEPYCIGSLEQQRTASDTVNGVTGITIDFQRFDNPLGGLDGKVSHVTIDNSDNPYNNTHDIVFYEGNDCTQGVKGQFHSDQDITANCRDSNQCDNDEIRSMMIYPGVSTSRVIKLYNDADGGKRDDWARVYIGDGFSTDTPYCLGSFEQQSTSEMKNRDIHIAFHRSDSGIGDGLDGKVSRILITDSSSPYDPDNIVFYEGNYCTQQIKGVFRSSAPKDVNCTSNSSCDNDEIRSVQIFPGIDKNTLIKVYNDTTPGAWDDWTRVHVGASSLDAPFCINGFEHQTSDREAAQKISVNHHASDSGIGNGLNGKISRVKIASSSSAHDPDNIIFYEGNNCTQEIKGIFQSSQAEDRNCDTSQTCAEDEIRSVLLYPGIDLNTLIKVYNDPEGRKNDDWSRIHIGQTQFTEPFCINGFEHNTSSREAAQNISVSHHQDDSGIGDGLNGKISHVKIATSSNPYDPDDIVFYSDYYCTSGIKGVFQSAEDAHVNCKTSSRCDNDEIKSVLLYPGTKKHKAMRLYDDPGGSRSDDYTSIYRGVKDLDQPFCIRGLEHDTSSREAAQGITVNYHPNNGLNGKVSYIKIVPSDEM